jgi:hypothetical protein
LRHTKIALAVVVILAVAGGAFLALYYNYLGLQFSLDGAAISGLELKPNWWITYNAFAGDPLQAAFSYIEIFELNLSVSIHNPGFLPVSIPTFNYTLYGNNVTIGQGSSKRSVTVPAGGSSRIYLKQEVPISDISTLYSSIVANNGELNTKIEGKAHIVPGLLEIPVRIERSVDVYQAAWNTIKEMLGI